MVVTGKDLDDRFFLTIRNLLKCLHDNNIFWSHADLLLLLYAILYTRFLLLL